MKLVTFETAVLAQAKGFPLREAYDMYLPDKSLTDQHYIDHIDISEEEYENVVGAPRQSQLAAWLRGCYDIQISVHKNVYKNEDHVDFVTEFSTTISDFRDCDEYPHEALGFTNLSPKNHEHTTGETYEEALELALVKGLEFI